MRPRHPLSILPRIAAAFLLAGIISCGKGGASSDANTIKVAYWGGPEEIAIIQDLVAEWQKDHPDVRVRLEHTPFSAYVSRLLTRMAGNVAPDIMAVEVNMFPSMWAKGAFQSLQPFIDRDATFNLEEFFPEVIERFSIDDNVYAIPRDTAPFACVYYNKTMFDQAKLAYPTDDWTWDDLLRLSQALTRKDADGRISRYGFYAWAWQNFVYSNGGKLVDDLYHPTKCLLGQSKAVEGLQFYADLINRYKVMPSSTDIKNLGMGAIQMFVAGKLAMFN